MRIYYYSATGNSLYVAKTIAAESGDGQLIPIANEGGNSKPSPDEECLGFVFPMHYFGLPPLVSSFIERLEIPSSCYVFAVVTCGHHLFGSSLQQIASLLRGKGKSLDAGFYVDMISNYLPLSDLPPEIKRKGRLGKAAQKVRLITEMIKERRHIMEAEYFRWPCQAVNSYWRRKLIRGAYAKFTNSSACTGCGLCARICPVGNIRLEAGKPVWGSHCQECLGCLHICPAESINFGKTQGRTRYRHPEVQIEELMRKS